ncbi:DUF423 domain-containing protein [Synoicihabitans lomoniglobus]|uniref:DUF423 domain-containing protein n=1 Tax=Synoicihabitans lomoniglobus TaxID=2909285 RepID=A0AAE9ZZ28_9BACT|nr:DUF423 domain-containing protein [Opitutaceae bacterium LMO-M01]WED63913.1 DUF423 domain-containing protein [Opitutaceae bacterium LMO-M01]
MKNISPIAATAALLGVIFGAFGAHALQETLRAAEMTKTWDTAVLYHLVHALAAWTLAGRPEREFAAARWAGRFWLVGILLFSGSLYLLALGGPRWLGPVTPLGGLALIAGWACAVKAALSEPAGMENS